MHNDLFSDPTQNAAFYDGILKGGGRSGATKAGKKPNFLQSLFPSIGGLVGGVGGGALGGAVAGSAILPGVGTAVGGLLGALLGGGAGGAAGKVAQNAATGQSLTHDVGKEAAIQGVLSAGPIRLLKGAAAGTKALVAGGEALAGDAATQGGGRLLSALNAGGEAAAAPSLIKTAISGKLGDAKDTLAAKALSLTGSEKSKILQKTGEKAGSIASRYGIRTADDVSKAAQPLFEEYAKAVSSIPGTFTKQEVEQAFKSAYEPLLAKGAPLGKQAEGEALKSEANNLLKGLGKEISPSDLNAKKTAFDELAYKFKMTDPTSHNVNKAARDVIHNLVTDAADHAGITTSQGTLKDTGAELIKLKRLGDAAGKHIDGAGGRTILGLGPVPGIGVGAAGGPAGAVAGGAANMVLNSQAGRKALATGAEKLAEKSAATAAKSGLENYGIKNVAKRVLPAGLAGALIGGSSQSDNSAESMPSETTPQIINNMDSTYADSGIPSNDAPTAASPFDPSNLEANVTKILQGGGKIKDVQDYISLVDALQKVTAPTKAAKLSGTQIQQANNAKSGLTDLSSLASIISSDPSVLKKGAIPGGPIARALTGTTGYEAAKQNVVDVIARLRSGAAITADEAKRYMGLLPGYADSRESAIAKLQRLNSLLEAFASPQSSQADIADVAALAQ